MGRIVVGVDGSANARRALEVAIEEARNRDATLEVVHAWSMPTGTAFAVWTVPDPAIFEKAGQQVLDAAIESTQDCGVTVEPLLAHGPASSVLLERSDGAQLLVVGARGHGGFVGLLLGSVASQVVEHAPCPVLVVPGRTPR